MDKLRAMELFIRLAELGSFTRLAEEKNASKSMISKEISRLESKLEARLFHRSTRKLQLTDIGRGYLSHCKDILLKIEEAESFVHNTQDRPVGKLKINAPMALGLTDLTQAFACFMENYPEIELEIHLSDEPIDLVQSGFDVGFRVSSRQLDTNYVGRPLTTFQYHICASPDYLSNHPQISCPDDLKIHNCFFYSYFQSGDSWPIGNGVEIRGNLKANNTLFMLEFIKKGLGIGFLPSFVCHEMLATGELVEILSSTSKPLLTLYALYPARHFVPMKLKYCIQHLENWFNDRNIRANHKN